MHLHMRQKVISLRVKESEDKTSFFLVVAKKRRLAASHRHMKFEENIWS